MAYDELGNFIGDMAYNQQDYLDLEEERRRREEEERKKREAELGNTVTKKHELTQYADGSLTKKTTEEIPGMPDQNEMGDIMGSINQVIGQQPEDMLLGAVADKIVPGSSPYVKAATGPDVPGLIDMATTQQPEEALVGNVAGKLTGNNDQSWQDIMKNNIRGYVDQERKGLGMGPVAPEGTPQPQQRQPGFAERILNAVIPSAAAATLPQAQQAPVARTLTPGEEIVPEQPQAGAGRGFVNPPQVNAPVAPVIPTPQGQAPQEGGLVNNNPGNIMFGDYAKRMGATGARPNGTAIFPDQNTGENAQHNLLSSSGYGNLSIRDIPQRWAPAGHGNNNPQAYSAGLQKLTGFDNETMGKKYNELSSGEQAAYRQAMQRIEHGTGSSGNLPDPTIANFQQEVIQRTPGMLGAYGPAKNGVDGTMGPATQAAIAANPDLAQKYGLQASGAQVEAQKTPAQLGIERYQATQDDPIGLFALRNDDSQPKYIRERAASRLADLMVHERNQAQGTQVAQDMIQKGDGNAIGRTLAITPKNPEGSAIKAALLNFIGAHKAAEEEMNRWGGYGDKYHTATFTDKNGVEQTVEVKTGYDGKVKEGFTIGDNPRRLDNQELMQAAGNALGDKISTSGTFFQTPDGQLLRAQVSEKGGKPRLVDAASGARYTGSTQGLTKLEEAGALRKMDRGLVIDLAKKHGNNVLDAEKDYVSLNGPFKTPEERQQFREAYGYGLAQPGPTPGVAPLPGQAPAGAVQAPVAPPAAGAPQGAPQRLQPVVPTAQAAPAPAPVVTAPSGNITRPIAEQQQGLKVGGAVTEAAGKNFVEKTAPEVNSSGEAGRQVAAIRRQQLSTIASNPSILNIFNGTGSNYDRARNVVTKLVTGAYGEENSGDFYKEVKSLGLTEAERGALEEFGNSNMAINSKTLKANSGAGSVSNAEQKANQNANLQNLAETTPLGAMQALHRSQFTGDMTGAKAAFLAAHPELNDDTKFNSAWAKESSKMTKAYEGIIDARAEYLKPFRPPADATPQQISAFKDKVFKAFEMYPAPQFNVETNKWDYRTANAQRAAARKLLGQ